MKQAPTRPAKRRFLVVDDSPEVRELLQDLLYEEGVTIQTAANGQDAVSQACSSSVDLILMDCEMPKLDGFEACRLIKSHESTRGVPVIMVTGFDDRERRLRGFAAGCDDFLAKPIDTEDLRARVRALLQEKRSGGFEA